MSAASPTHHVRSRRGVAVAMVLLVVSVLALAVAGSVEPLSQEMDLAALRVETTRAFFAAESGAGIYTDLLAAGITPPLEETQIRIGSQTIRFLGTPEQTGLLVVEGSSGLSTRRIEIQLE